MFFLILQKPLQIQSDITFKGISNPWNKSADKYHSKGEKHLNPQTLKEDVPGLNKLIHSVRP